MFGRSLLAVALLCSCSPPPTSVSIKITSGDGNDISGPLSLSVFDAHHALATHLSLGEKALPLVAVAYNLPASAEAVRLVVARSGAAAELGGASVQLTPRARASVSLVISATTSDSDHDGIPDNVDNCPTVFNPDQASRSGAGGDACGGGGDGGIDGSVDLSVPLTDLGPPTDLGSVAALYAFSYTLPAHKSLFYGGHDGPPATITFSSNADSTSCSHDGGATFAACNSATTLLFTPDDYNSGATLQIKLSSAGRPTYVASLNPKLLMPGLTFYNCDQVVTADEDTTTFAKRIAAGRVVCVGPNVGITDSSTHDDDGGVHISPTGIFLQKGNAAGLKLIGTESSLARFFNPDVGGNQGILISMDTTVHDVVVSNLNLVSADGNPISFDTNGGNNWFSNLVVETGGGQDQAIVFSMGLNQLYNVTVHVESSGGTPALTVNNSATVICTGGHLFGRDDTNAISVSDGNLTLSNVAVDNASQTITATKAPAVNVYAGILKVTGGSISSSYSDGLDVASGGVVTLTNSSVSGVGIGISAASSNLKTSGVTVSSAGIGIKLASSMLTLDTTLVERLDQAGSANAAILVTGAGNSIDSSADKNHFCDVNKAGSNVFNGSVVKDAASGGMYNGTFALANQVNAGVVDQCP